MSASAMSYERIYSVVARIPRGRVATYGQVARLAGLPGRARLVGYALSALTEESRPVRMRVQTRRACPRDGSWMRVVNAKGCISARRDGSPMSIVQRLRLERERVRFDAGKRK
jgi:methylated-DNA-protein-cysteine methyltransferase-like protein